MMAVSFIISSSSPSLVVTSKGISTDDGWIKHTTLHHLRECRVHMCFIRLKTCIIKSVETIDILLVEQGLPKRSDVLDNQLASLLKERSSSHFCSQRARHPIIHQLGSIPATISGRSRLGVARAGSIYYFIKLWGSKELYWMGIIDCWCMLMIFHTRDPWFVQATPLQIFFRTRFELDDARVRIPKQHFSNR